MVKGDNFYRQILPNGLKVIFEKRDTPLVVNMAATKFGYGYESANVKGIAHLIEHSVFRRTKTRTSQQITSSIENLGGKINAFTSDDVTAYYTKLRADHFEVGMDILADITLNPSFNKRDIDMEKKIVIQEINMRHDSPRVYVMEKLKEQMYAAPFGSMGAGTAETVNSILKKDMQKYHSIYYSPSNMVMAIVGRADVDYIWNLSKKHFLKKQVQRRIDQRQKLKIAPGNFGSFVEKRKGVDQAHLAMGYYQPTMKDNLRYASEIFNHILGDGFNSKLFQEIREKRGLAYNVVSYLNQDSEFSYGEIYLGTEKSKLDISKKIALAELKKMKKIDAKEVDQAKESLIGKYILKGESSEDVAMELLQEELNGDGKEYYHYPQKIAEVKLEQVREVANISNLATSMVLPED